MERLMQYEISCIFAHTKTRRTAIILSKYPKGCVLGKFCHGHRIAATDHLPCSVNSSI